MNIREFINKAKATHDYERRNRPASSVLLGPLPDIDWPATLKKAGYFSYHIKTLKTWTSMHEWCREKFGDDHYAWTGAQFWFETKEDATMFILRWS